MSRHVIELQLRGRIAASIVAKTVDSTVMDKPNDLLL